MKKINNIFKVFSILTILCIAIYGCKKEQKNEIPENIKKTFTSKEDSVYKMIRESEAKYKEMSVPELIRKMEFDSEKGREQFNSPAYREITGRKNIIAEELFKSISGNTNKYLLSLLALRKINKELYLKLDPVIRAQILTDALAKSNYYNIWGLPHLYLEDASHAMIESDTSAVTYLKQILKDNSKAELWGSEEVMESKSYGYRKSDYAMFFIMRLKGDKSEFPSKPQDRDIKIQELMK